MIDNPVMSFEASPISLTRSVSFLVQYRHVASVVKVGGGGRLSQKILTRKRNMAFPEIFKILIRGRGGDEKAARWKKQMQWNERVKHV